MGNTDNYLGLFNTRETAIIIWILIFLAWAISQKKIRDSLFGLGKAFLHLKIFSIIIATILYASLIVYFLSKIGIWRTSLAKDTAFWLLGTAFVLLMNANQATQGGGFFKKIMTDNFKLVLVLEFVVNLYTFNLLIELILVPILFVIIGIGSYAEAKKEFLPVKKTVYFILSIIGFFIIFYAFAKLIGDYQSITTSENMRAFILPPLLTFAYIPFLYIFALIMAYENLFMRINYFRKDNKILAKYTKRKILLLCNLDLRKLNRFSRDNMQRLVQLSSEEDVRKLISEFKADRLLGQK